MKKILTLICISLFSITLLAHENEWTKGFVKGKAEIGSISALTFGPDGILFLGDSKSSKVFALDLEDRSKSSSLEPFELKDIETKLAAFLGTTKEGVVIHDLAVNPLSQNIYIAASRSNAKSLGFWKLPNDLTYANTLIKISLDGEFSEVNLDDINHSQAEIPNPIPEGSKTWRESDKRTETITDLEFYDGKVYVAGISNEEFASTLRVFDFPFQGPAKWNTVEIWHAAHGKFETQAPIRTLLPYNYGGQGHLLAAYTCTPLVSLPLTELDHQKHIKAKTLAELGSGNIPLDIIAYNKDGKEHILIANSSRSLMRIDPDDLESQKEVTEDVDNGNTAGVPYVPLSKVGILQIDNLNQHHVLTLQRMPNGDLDLRTYPTKWL